jgi:hypothetical protein
MWQAGGVYCEPPSALRGRNHVRTTRNDRTRGAIAVVARCICGQGNRTKAGRVLAANPETGEQMINSLRPPNIKDSYQALVDVMKALELAQREQTIAILLMICLRVSAANTTAYDIWDSIEIRGGSCSEHRTGFDSGALRV